MPLSHASNTKRNCYWECNGTGPVVKAFLEWLVGHLHPPPLLLRSLGVRVSRMRPFFGGESLTLACIKSLGDQLELCKQCQPFVPGGNVKLIDFFVGALLLPRELNYATKACRFTSLAIRQWHYTCIYHREICPLDSSPPECRQMRLLSPTRRPLINVHIFNN